MFAIRQKSTGFFMPQFGKNQSKGGTWLEPAANCVPRLFRRRQDAKGALGHWLKGRLERKFSFHPETLYEDLSLEYRKVEERNPDDMEIVEVEVRVL